MAVKRLYKYSVTVYEPVSGTDATRTPTTGAYLQALYPGCIAAAAGSVAVSTTGFIQAYDINSPAQATPSPALTAHLSVLGSTNARSVSGVVTSGIITLASGATAFSWDQYDRFLYDAGSSNPKMYHDPAGSSAYTASGSDFPTTDANGGAVFYSYEPRLDISINDGGTYTAIYDVAGEEMGSDEVRPEEFGAYRDGSNDDATAFKNAIAYLKLRNGGVLRLQAGTYKLSSEIDLDGVSGVIVRGAGMGVTVLSINHSGNGLDLTGASTDVTVTDLTMTRVTAPSGTVAHIKVGSSCSRIDLARIKFISGGGAGTAVYDQGADTTYVDCRLTGSTAWNYAYYGYAAKRPYIRRIVVRPEANWTGGTGMFRFEKDTEDAIMRDCVIDPTGSQVGTSVVVSAGESGTNDPRNILVSGCTLGQGALASTSVISVTAGTGITFESCQVRDGLTAFSLTGGVGIRVVNCTISNMGNIGVYCFGATYVQVIGCTISDIDGNTTGQSYIWLRSGNHIQIIGCMFGDMVLGSGSGGASDVVDIDSGVTDVQILGCGGDTSVIGQWLDNASTSGMIDVSHIPADATADVGYAHTVSVAGSNNTVPGSIGRLVRTTGGSNSFSVAGVSSVRYTPASNATVSDMTSAVDGQIVTITNFHATNTVAFANGAKFKNDGAATVTLSQYESVSYQWDETSGLWIMLGTAMTV